MFRFRKVHPADQMFTLNMKFINDMLPFNSYYRPNETKPVANHSLIKGEGGYIWGNHGLLQKLVPIIKENGLQPVSLRSSDTSD